jgi:hypothetical protein
MAVDKGRGLAYVRNREPSLNQACSCQQEATRDREIEADSIRKKDITLEDSPLYITAATQTEEMEVHLDITEEKVESTSEKEVATAADDASLKTQVPLQIRSTAHAF